MYQDRQKKSASDSSFSPVSNRYLATTKDSLFSIVQALHNYSTTIKPFPEFRKLPMFRFVQNYIKNKLCTLLDLCNIFFKEFQICCSILENVAENVADFPGNFTEIRALEIHHLCLLIEIAGISQKFCRSSINFGCHFLTIC